MNWQIYWQYESLLIAALNYTVFPASYANSSRRTIYEVEEENNSFTQWESALLVAILLVSSRANSAHATGQCSHHTHVKQIKLK